MVIRQRESEIVFSGVEAKDIEDFFWEGWCERRFCEIA